MGIKKGTASFHLSAIKISLVVFLITGSIYCHPRLYCHSREGGNPVCSSVGFGISRLVDEWVIW